MLTEHLNAATAAFRVGYESPSQFNREYRRFLTSRRYATSRPCVKWLAVREAMALVNPSTPRHNYRGLLLDKPSTSSKP